MASVRWAAVAVAVAATTVGTVPARAEDPHPFWLTVYLQQSFPKQTTTNEQIEQINQTFGVDFDTWDDVTNLSLGAQLFSQVAPNWLVGAEIDYSRGGIDGKATVPTEAGPATLKFEQKYSIYADLLAVAHYLPCPTCRKAVPFVLLGAGLGYEKDTTTLTLRNEYLDEGLKVKNDGTFPVYTVGVGMDVFLSQDRTWYFDFGGAYYWGRLKHKVSASGSLAPAPEVTADNDTTGPNYWIGFGRRF